MVGRFDQREMSRNEKSEPGCLTILFIMLIAIILILVSAHLGGRILNLEQRVTVLEGR